MLLRPPEDLEELGALAGGVEPLLMCLGGSSVSERRNPMSDTDLFAIGAPALAADVRALTRHFERSDLEWRTTAWLAEISAGLATFKPGLAVGPSPFSWMDLRFLARMLLGVQLIDRGGLMGQLRALAEPVRIALAAYVSTFYVNTYEDVLGLRRAGRDVEALVLAGELAQRAALLALLQNRLVEPASKWALAIARTDSGYGLETPAQRMLDHLAQYDAQQPAHWVTGLLWRANALVAAGVLSGGGGKRATRAAPPSDGLCVLGAPGYIAVIDLDRSEVAVCNRAFLEQYLQDEPANSRVS